METDNSRHSSAARPQTGTELSWLKEAGFRDVDVFWKFTNYAVYGGFR